jgi:bacterioferritin-associated ferredoxin
MHDHVMAIAEPAFPARGRCGSDFALLSPLAGVGVECGGCHCDATESIEVDAAGVTFWVT